MMRPARIARGGRRPAAARGAMVGAAVLAGAALVAGCGGSGGGEAGTTAPARDGATIRVPADQPSIQKAVDAASVGDTVLIAPGTYREAVEVDTDGITIRGANRNTVILDGGDQLGDGISVDANDVAVENLTVRGYQNNGVLIDGSNGLAEGGEGGQEPPEGAQPGKGDFAIDGYRVSYVTAANNGLYGIYAFASRNGVIEHSYASGSPDSGVYIGQCDPCNAVVRDVVMRDNAIGYFATNTRGRVVVTRSEMSGNRLGVALNSDDAELGAPQQGTIMRGNVITGNKNPKAPAIEEGFSGGGIGIAGGRDNVLSGNRITGNGDVGVLILNQQGYRATANRFTGNTITGQQVDVVVTGRAAGCFSGNQIGASNPADIEQVAPCTGAPTSSAARTPWTPAPAAPDIDYRKIPLPPPQPNMPGGSRR